MEKLLDSVKKSKGLTLIELLTAISIFVIVITAVSGIFISGIRSQTHVLATQELLDQASYAVEYMGRTLRMAKKDIDGICISPGYNYQLTGDGGIMFIDYEGKCTKFFLENHQIKKKDILSGSVLELTSSKITVNSFKINISGESQTDYIQPRITLSLEILGRKSISQSKIIIQTSISQRNLDVQY